MPLYVYIVLGFTAGTLASFMLGERRGWLMNTIVGAAGASLGGFVFSLLGECSITGLNLWSFVVSLLGALLLSAFLRVVAGPQPS
jgi:uncharacterized membrane protein YeaQ/YmgE (transglycosylase-associated protein family)